MIFLAGLPGGGKSTLLRQLKIEDQFTNCNIDNFYEPALEKDLGTKNLHVFTKRFFELRDIREERGFTPEERKEYEEVKGLKMKSDRLFWDAISKFSSQVGEVCQTGSNFIIDGTAANYGRITADAIKYRKLGYDTAMIFVDIDTETSVARNLQRGEKGGRAIYSKIIQGQGERLPAHIEPYREFFGEDRFFLVPNKGTFDEYKLEIEKIRPGIKAFMEA